MISLDVSTAEAFAPYPAENDVPADATVHAYNTGSETDAYYLVVNHSGYGKVKLILIRTRKCAKLLHRSFLIASHKAQAQPAQQRLKRRQKYVLFRISYST